MSLSAINHKRLDRINELTRNYNKATLLDKFIFWWQHSTYTLNDNQKWFTRSVTRIAEDSGISKRSVERYMSQFEKMGLIERRNVLLRKKNLYIRITAKLLNQLGLSSKKQTQNEVPQESNSKPSSLNLAHIGGNKSGDLAVSYIRCKEQIVKTNSTVSNQGIVNNSDELTKNPNIQAKTEKTENSGYKIEKDIGERLTSRFKNYIKGVLTNLQSQHNVIFSNPDKVFAEVVFAVTHEDNQLKGITNPHHRMNIIAKLMREQRWRTPKGFYNHWDIGKLFRERDEVNQRRYEAEKQEEGVDATSIAKERKTHFNAVKSKVEIFKQTQELKNLKLAIRETENELKTELRQLDAFKKAFTQGHKGVTQATIDSYELAVSRLFEKVTEQKAMLAEAETKSNAAP